MLPTVGCGQTTDPARTNRLTRRGTIILCVLAVVLACSGPGQPAGPNAPTQPSVPTGLDPAAWGGDHVGQPLASYVTGEECLFCHRDESTNNWAANPHSRTIRLATTDSAPMQALASVTADEVEMLLGSQDRVRFLKQIGYGRVALHSATWESGDLTAHDGAPWDDKLFATNCAGCHTTAVNPATSAYSSPSLDCYVCHGNVDLEHSEDPAKMLLSKARQDPARVVISICAQCHIRSGRSRSSGLPYPNNFIAGDNLFRDFEVDFSDQALANLSSADRHILETARDVVINGEEAITCLNCHNVHASTHTKHEDVFQQLSCFTCHIVGREKSELLPFTIRSATCER